MQAKSIHAQSIHEIQSALDDSMADGFKPTLAFVFISIKNDLDGVIRLLDQAGVQIFGATSSGEFTDGNVSHGSAAILLMDMKPSNFKILFDEYKDKDPASVAMDMAKTAKKYFKNPSFMLSVSINSRDESEVLLGDPVLKALESVTGKSTSIWGGRAGDDFIFDESIVFTNKHSSKRAIILLVLDGDQIVVRGEAASGIKPIGTEKTITKSDGKWIYEIDHQPAAEVLLKYLGLKFTPEEAEAFYPKEGIMFSVNRGLGDPVIRGVGIFNWKDKSFSSLGNIIEGEKFRFCLPPDFTIVDEVRENAEHIQKHEIPDADALLMFSCVGRLGQFGPLINDEIEGVRNAFNVPMAGFFTYGEFGRANRGDNEFHTSTCCWAVIKEK
jgi:hypothetical protein